MIDFICNANWTPYGVDCGSESAAAIVYKFLREAVMDRHIYISKIIGFSFDKSDIARTGNGEYITRHKQIGESYPELINILGDKIFLEPEEGEYSAKLEVTEGNDFVNGINNVYTSPFLNKLNQQVEVLCTDPYLCRCLKGTNTLHVITAYDCGYRSTSYNSHIVKSNSFPCFTDHSLNDFVRVLPRSNPGPLVPIRFYNGMSVDHFKQILSNWGAVIKSSNIRKGERQWLRSFQQLQRKISVQ